MKNINLRSLLAAVVVCSIMAAFTRIEAGPVKFDQVVQVMNARPGQGLSANFARLQVADYSSSLIVGDDDDDKKKGRVITETRTEIVTDEDCDCEQVEAHRGFPKWALLGLAAIPIAFIIIKRKKDTPTPTPTTTIPGQTPTPTPATPTPTPKTPTPTPTPPMTPTPTPPQPVPEPITILLFGTGLASVGMAARRRLGKKKSSEGDEK